MCAKLPCAPNNLVVIMHKKKPTYRRLKSKRHENKKGSCGRI